MRISDEITKLMETMNGHYDDLTAMQADCLSMDTSDPK